MARQKTKRSKKSGSIQVKTARSAYASRLRGPKDPEVTAAIDAQVREGEAIRADIERRIEARLVGY